MANRTVDFDLDKAIRALDQQYIEHGSFLSVLQEVREVLSFGLSPNEAICLHIGGPAGVGKSTLRRKLALEYPVVRDGWKTEIRGSSVVADHVPLLQIEIPNKPTVKSICYAILHAYGEENVRRSDETAMSYRVSNYIKACGTVAVLFDEAQRIIDKPGMYSSEHILDWCKWIHARNGISIILIGLSRLRYLFEKDDQLDRRWNAELRMSEYWWHDANGNDDLESQSMFMAILAAYRDVFPIPFDIDVEDEVVAFRFFYASQGLFGNLKKLMKEALRMGARRLHNKRKITLDVLEEAFDRAFHPEARNVENPFRKEFVLRMPPRPKRDDVLLPPSSARRKAKTKKAVQMDADRALVKS